MARRFIPDLSTRTRSVAAAVTLLFVTASAVTAAAAWVSTRVLEDLVRDQQATLMQIAAVDINEKFQVQHGTFQPKVVPTHPTFVMHSDGGHVVKPTVSFGRTIASLDAAPTTPGGTTMATIDDRTNTVATFERPKAPDGIAWDANPQDEAINKLIRMQRGALIIAFLLLAGFVPLTWWLARRQSRPLQALKERIQNAHDHPIQTTPPLGYANDEVGELSRAFDTLMRERSFAEAKYQAHAEEMRAATESSLDSFCIFQADHDATGNIVDFHFRYVNPNAEKLIGRPSAELINRSMNARLHPSLAGELFSRFVRVMNSGEPMQVDLELHLPNEPLRWFAHQIIALANGVAITSRENTAQRRDESELRSNRAFLRTMIDTLPLGVYTKSAMPETFGQFLIWNKYAEVISGFRSEDVVGKTGHEIFSARAAAAYEEHDRKMLADPMPLYINDVIFRRQDGVMRPIELKSVPFFNDADEIEYMLGIFEDVTLRKESEIALFEEKERLRVTLSSIGDAVISTDTNGIVTYINPVAERITGWPSAEATGQKLEDVFRVICAGRENGSGSAVESILSGDSDNTMSTDTILLQRSGNRLPIEECAAPITDSQGQSIGVVVVFRDVSKAQEMAAEMSYQATHDELTGLINRREFERKLDGALQSSIQHPKEHTLLYMDLDQFKVVNDTCGHVAGDELLRQLTRLLLDKLRQSDTLGRLGGDEFGILLESCSQEPAARVAEVLRHAVSDFQFVWLDKVFSLGVSIGLVTFDGSLTLADVLRMADAACYLAKDRGRNRVHIHTEDDQELARRHGEMGWVGRIKRALEDQRFVLYSQQIQPLGDDGAHGEHYELLVRMLDEEGKLIPPMSFIPAAERYGLMPLLDRWVITTAFSRFAERHPAGCPPPVCAINLSGTSICDDDFLAFVLDQFAKYPVAPNSICFEITETAAIANLSLATTLIRELKAIGCRFALDDFGSGMSSFAYLKNLHVDYLKIDGGFVKDMMTDPIDHAMVDAINRVGQVMGIQTVAEFVENDAIAQALRALGVNFAQGYGIEKPRPAFGAQHAST